MAMPFRPVRRGQLIHPFGVGSMVDFPRDEALMTAGLDVWPGALENCPHEWVIHEERLQRRLRVTHFRLPPDFRPDDLDPSYGRQYIPFVRFPKWHYCTGFRCGKMEKLLLFGGGRARCRDRSHAALPETRQPRLVPVRFVSICPQGHIEDFPFMEWVHGGRDPVENGHALSYRTGTAPALSGIVISCSCGAKRSLSGAFNFDVQKGGPLHLIGYDCRGDQPWLGITDGSGNPCGAFLRVVQRGGSNVYFPKIYSSIHLPLWGEQVDPRVVRVLEDPRAWSTLTNGLEEGKRVSLDRCKVVADLRNIDATELREAAQRRLDGSEAEREVSEEDFRRAEYEAFLDERGGEGTDLLVEARPVRGYADWCNPYLEQVRLVRKLRETRTLASFSRLFPAGSETEEAQQPLSRGHGIDWLPAVTVRGEGIFFQFRLDSVEEWLSRAANRIDELQSSYNKARIARHLVTVPINAKFVLLHTFAHRLIRQLSQDCGYGSAALRERIYCDREDTSQPMHGILIYTAAGDSEGTMGGLVRKGEPGNLEFTMMEAILGASWCSSDPVCIDSHGQGTDNANLGACHSCALLPETACEEGNKFLDRALLTGVPRNPQLGFFKDLME